MKNYFLILCSVLLIGCASTKSVKTSLTKLPSIIVTANKVEFDTRGKPAEMSYKKGDAEYKYNSKEIGFWSKLFGGAMAMGARR